MLVDLNPNGYLECVDCRLHPDEPADSSGSHDQIDMRTRFGSTAAMHEHLLHHEAAGHVVPRRTYRTLERDAQENDTWMARQV